MPFKVKMPERAGKAGLDEGLLSFCLPSFSFIWRIPIDATHSSDE
jgi:hypothetical protein